jgi:hypothetical protein
MHGGAEPPRTRPAHSTAQCVPSSGRTSQPSSAAVPAGSDKGDDAATDDDNVQLPVATYVSTSANLESTATQGSRDLKNGEDFSCWKKQEKMRPGQFNECRQITTWVLRGMNLRLCALGQLWPLLEPTCRVHSRWGLLYHAGARSCLLTSVLRARPAH